MTCARRLLTASLAVALSMEMAAGAQPAVSCPPDTRLAVEPLDDGGWQGCVRVADGRPHGPTLASYTGGRKRIQGQYRDGAPVGHWLGWHRNGGPAGEADFQAGQLHRLVGWDERGTLVFDLDLKAGRLAEFDGRGRRRLLVENMNGVPTKKHWDETGALISDESDRPESMAAPEFVQMMLVIAGLVGPLG